VNLSIALAAIALLTGLTVLPLRLLDFRLQRTVGDSLRESQSTHLAPRPSATADPSVLAEPTREAAAPAEGGASSAAKRRLVGRVTALLGLALLLVGIPLANRLTKQNDVLQPPSTAFAEWSNPRRAQLLLLLKDLQFELGGLRYVPTLHVEPLEEAAFDAPILNEASPPPNESAKGPPDEIQ
jgi:hypothetical protein